MMVKKALACVVAITPIFTMPAWAETDAGLYGPSVEDAGKGTSTSGDDADIKDKPIISEKKIGGDKNKDDDGKKAKKDGKKPTGDADSTSDAPSFTGGNILDDMNLDFGNLGGSAKTTGDKDKDDDGKKAKKDGRKLTGDTVVSFGDSYFADSASPTTGVGLSGCPQGPTNIPRLTAEKLGLDLKDYSCSGAVAYLGEGAGGQQTITEQVDMALENGDLNDKTALVPISIGGNDGMPQAIASPEGVISRYRDKMGEVLPRIKKAAPNAKIQLVGYPKMTTERGNYCVPTGIDLNGFGLFDILPGNLVTVEETINEGQRLAAEDNGVDFVDIKDDTNGHGPCAPADKRWVSGMWDATAQTDWKMPLHLTGKANEFISDTLAEEAGGDYTARTPEEIDEQESVPMGMGGVQSVFGQMNMDVMSDDILGQLTKQVPAGGAPVNPADVGKMIPGAPKLPL